MDREIPRWMVITMLTVVGLLAIMMFISRDCLHVYQTYFRERSPEITTHFNALSVEMDEAAVRQHFSGVALNCIPESGSDLGDRVCYSSISKADGQAALTLAIFSKKGKLTHAIVQIPWWAHRTWLQSLKTRHGQFRYAGVVGGGGGPVLRWELPGGYLEMNRDRGYNPLTWSVLIWTGTQRGTM